MDLNRLDISLAVVIWKLQKRVYNQRSFTSDFVDFEVYRAREIHERDRLRVKNQKRGTRT